MSRVAKKAARHFKKVAKLQTMGQAGRAELKRMRDVWYDTDSAVTAGEFHNPKGKRMVKGSDAKALRIQSAHNAKARQGI